MVKTPKTRHARTQREPVTIDLGPDEVRRIEEEAAAADENAETGPAVESTAGDSTQDAVAQADEAAGESAAESRAAEFVPEPAAVDAPDAAFAAAASEERMSTRTSQQDAPHFGRARPQPADEPAAPAPQAHAARPGFGGCRRADRRRHRARRRRRAPVCGLDPVSRCFDGRRHRLRGRRR